MSFAQPIFLVALALVPLALAGYLRQERLRRAAAASFASPANVRAPARPSAASLLSDRPSARTSAPASSSSRVISRPVWPVAPITVIMSCLQEGWFACRPLSWLYGGLYMTHSRRFMLVRPILWTSAS